MKHVKDYLKIVEAALGDGIAVRVHSKNGQVLEASQIGISGIATHKIDGKKVPYSIYKASLIGLVESTNLQGAEVGFINRRGVFVPFILKEGG